LELALIARHRNCTNGQLSRCFERSNPDKVITRPYLGREAVRFSSILHDDLKGRTAAAG
jgi:hypothetical protein